MHLRFLTVWCSACSLFFTMTPGVNGHPIDLQQVQPRYDMLDMENSQLTLPWLAAHQRRLVTKSGTLEALGTLRQLPNGAIDTRDFGQNIHDKGEQIMDYEKYQAIDEMKDMIIKFLAERITHELRLHIFKKPAQKVPIWTFK